MNKECCDLIALNMVPGLGPRKIMALLGHAEGANKIKSVRNSRRYAEEIEFLKKNGISSVCWTDKEYPELLKNIYDPPSVLFYKGALCPADVNAVAIVGSRRCSAYGLQMAEKLAFDLAERGVTVISGMANGIDTAAHRGALRARGRTIAVMGSGFRHIYPPEAGKLISLIIENGAVMTEYLSGTPPARSNFPRRNRIISGMTEGVVVVEAARKSGAMITVNFALEQGREVFAVPGRADAYTSSGTNKLIQTGAKLVMNADDILEELNMDLCSDKNTGNTHKNGSNTHQAEEGSKRDEEPLTREQQEILATLDREESMQIDYIIDCASIERGRLLENLLKLEIRGLVKKHPGSRYSVKKEKICA